MGGLPAMGAPVVGITTCCRLGPQIPHHHPLDGCSPSSQGVCNQASAYLGLLPLYCGSVFSSYEVIVGAAANGDMEIPCNRILRILSYLTTFTNVHRNAFPLHRNINNLDTLTFSPVASIIGTCWRCSGSCADTGVRQGDQSGRCRMRI